MTASMIDSQVFRHIFSTELKGMIDPATANG